MTGVTVVRSARPPPRPPRLTASGACRTVVPVQRSASRRTSRGNDHEHAPYVVAGGRRRAGGAVDRAGSGGGADPHRMARGVDRAELGTRDRLQPRRDVRRGRGQRGARPSCGDRDAGHAGRSDQGGERDPGADQPREGERSLGPHQLRRSAGDHADPGTGEDADRASLRRRQPHRPGEVPDCVPDGPLERPVGRRGARLRAEAARRECGRGVRRHHRLRHECGGRQRGRLHQGWREGRQPGADRREPAGRDARHDPRAGRRGRRRSWSGR